MVDDELDVSSAVANRMSLFYAHATPMLNVLSDTTSRFVAEVGARCFDSFLKVERFRKLLV